MKAKQKGVVPLAATVIGLCIMLYCGGALLLGLDVTATHANTSNAELQWPTLVRLIGVLLAFAAFIVAGFGVAGIFPTIVTTDNGLILRHPLISVVTVRLKWSEISKVIALPFPSGWAAIVVSKPWHNMLFPGRLHLFYLCGIAMRRLNPVVLLSRGTDNLEQLIEEIRNRTEKKV